MSCNNVTNWFQAPTSATFFEGVTWVWHNYFTWGQEFMVSKVLCAIFGNLYSLHFLPLSPLWWNFQTKTGTEPLTP